MVPLAEGRPELAELVGAHMLRGCLVALSSNASHASSSQTEVVGLSRDILLLYLAKLPQPREVHYCSMYLCKNLSTYVCIYLFTCFS